MAIDEAKWVFTEGPIVRAMHPDLPRECTSSIRFDVDDKVPAWALALLPEVERSAYLAFMDRQHMLWMQENKRWPCYDEAQVEMRYFGRSGA